jgi:hypothetical protein
MVTGPAKSYIVRLSVATLSCDQGSLTARSSPGRPRTAEFRNRVGGALSSTAITERRFRTLGHSHRLARARTDDYSLVGPRALSAVPHPAPGPGMTMLDVEKCALSAQFSTSVCRRTLRRVPERCGSRKADAGAGREFVERVVT